MKKEIVTFTCHKTNPPKRSSYNANERGEKAYQEMYAGWEKHYGEDGDRVKYEGCGYTWKEAFTPDELAMQFGDKPENIEARNHHRCPKCGKSPSMKVPSISQSLGKYFTV